MFMIWNTIKRYGFYSASRLLIRLVSCIFSIRCVIVTFNDINVCIIRG